MACRFPGASDPETLWQNLAGGVESIRRFSREELLAEGIAPALVDHPRFVAAHGALDDIKGFDAAFFGYSPGDAALTDPQQRIFLECAYEAFDNAGIVPREGGPVTGVFAGCGVNVYFIHNVFPSLDQDDVGAVYQAVIGSEKDFLTARVNYKLGLTGPSVTIQAACATSLVAVHVACQSLLNGECDLAVAGGASIRVPQASGYLFSEGGVHSADGYCRAFDAEAGGIVGGSGAGAVLLKRLADAQRDGDPIHAVILGSAVNNDGSRKVSFTAPGVDGQATVIAEARAVAGVEPTSIGYAEMHGTATALGDPIEIAAVRQAMGDDWNPRWRCYIGSVKTNLGHLDSVAGLAGLIKTALSLQHASIPPSLHFVKANSALDLDSGPLRVAATPTEWPAIPGPRRASVSSFGLGGNNSHAVLEQAPVEEPRAPARDAWRLFPLSARTDKALGHMRERLAGYLEKHDELRADDVAWTLARGRQVFSRRGYVVARSTADLAAALRTGDWRSGDRKPARNASDESAKALEGLGEQWLAGSEIDWEGVFAADRPRRIALPTYPFEHTPHWIDQGSRPSARALAAPVAGDGVRLAVPSWARADRSASKTGVRRWLVVGGGDPLTRAIVAQLRSSGAEVSEATAEAPQSTAGGVLITSGFDGAIRVARALGQGGITATEIVAVTVGATDVIGDEPLDPMQATTLGPVLTIPMEFPGVHGRVIDVDGRDVAAGARAVVEELASGAGDAVVALRHGQRWLPQIIDTRTIAGRPVDGVVREHGVYVIVGGTGGIGLALAKAFAARAAVHLALVSRQGPESAAARHAVAALEGSGSTVRVYGADVADRAAMEAVFAELRVQYGSIHGVVHAAGLAGGGALARRTDREMEAVMRPKVAGADVLGDLAAAQDLDFLVFCSSLSVYLPFPGQADYAAANTYLDAKAAALRRAGVRAVSINWDAWRDIGMALMADMPDAVRAAREAELAVIGLDPDRACETFLKILASDLGQVLVTMRPEFTAFRAPVVEIAHAAPAAASVAGGLADVWKTLLGVADVKPGDDFFDLGGHSLLATSVVFQIRQTWGCSVSVDELFANSTFQELAALVESRAAGGDREELVL
jgi:3-oxoacyl-(acyl-carrier-protein) synthase/NAD(P)-dependent dehydrogenase (short-subunit alcohol dehydrogenase family)